MSSFSEERGRVLLDAFSVHSVNELVQFSFSYHTVVKLGWLILMVKAKIALFF